MKPSKTHAELHKLLRLFGNFKSSWGKGLWSKDMDVWVISVSLPNTHRISVCWVLEEQEAADDLLCCMCCVSSVLCPCLCLAGQLLPLQLGQPKIIWQTKCWQEISTCCFVMINPASGVSLWKAVGAQQLLACDKKPFAEGGLCCLYRAPICGSQPGGLWWDLEEVSSGARQYTLCLDN